MILSSKENLSLEPKPNSEQTADSISVSPSNANAVLSDLLFIVKNYKLWKHWRRIKNGAKTMDFKRGCGYYITVGLLGCNPIGKVEELEMKSGKVGLYELIDYKTFRDPYDMIEESWWHFVGYKGKKAIKDCSFKEAVFLYFR